MVQIVVAGVAVVDFVFKLEDFPDRAEKYRTHDAAITGGGCGANAAVAIARLGGEAILVSRLGDDPVGDMIVREVEDEGVDCSLVKRYAGCKSSFSSVFLNHAGERQIVNYRDPNLSMDADWLAAEFPSGPGAVLADTRWPQGAIVAMQAAEKAGIPGIVDAEAPVLDSTPAIEIASHVAFSAQGLRDFTGTDSLQDGLHDAAKKTSAWLCVTDGENGVQILANGVSSNIPAYKIKAVDTLGAGDVWHGAFALLLAEGKREEQAVMFANAVAAIKCTQMGGRAGAPDRTTVNTFMKGNEPCN